MTGTTRTSGPAVPARDAVEQRRRAPRAPRPTLSPSNGWRPMPSPIPAARSLRGPTGTATSQKAASSWLTRQRLSRSRLIRPTPPCLPSRLSARLSHRPSRLLGPATILRKEQLARPSPPGPAGGAVAGVPRDVPPAPHLPPVLLSTSSSRLPPLRMALSRPLTRMWQFRTAVCRPVTIGLPSRPRPIRLPRLTSLPRRLRLPRQARRQGPRQQGPRRQGPRQQGADRLPNRPWLMGLMGHRRRSKPGRPASDPLRQLQRLRHRLLSATPPTAAAHPEGALRPVRRARRGLLADPDMAGDMARACRFAPKGASHVR